MAWMNSGTESAADIQSVAATVLLHQYGRLFPDSANALTGGWW